MRTMQEILTDELNASHPINDELLDSDFDDAATENAYEQILLNLPTSPDSY